MEAEAALRESAVLRERYERERANNAALAVAYRQVADGSHDEWARREALIRKAIRCLEVEPNNARMQQCALWLKEALVGAE